MELLSHGVEFVTETNETYNSILEASITHTGNFGTMLADEIAHVNERIDSRCEEIENIEKDVSKLQEWTMLMDNATEKQAADIDLLKGETITLKDLVQSLIIQTGRLEDNRVRLTRCVSELTGEVRDLQRRCQGEEVRVEEEEPMIPEQAKSRPARFVVPVEGQLIPIDDEVIKICKEEFYRNVGVVHRDSPCPHGRGLTPLITVTDTTLPLNQWPALEFDPYAEFIPDSEPNSDTELPDCEDLPDVDPNEIREQNWANEELPQSLRSPRGQRWQLEGRVLGLEARASRGSAGREQTMRGKVAMKVGRTKRKTIGKPRNETTNNKLRETSGNIGIMRPKSRTTAGHERPEGQRRQDRDDEETEGRTVAMLLGLREREGERERERENTADWTLRVKGTKGNEPK
ncbi:hypothetical protein BJ322DRAFT_1022916 [Thelephora terrestris]|uniref:Uncharacterized protein n=1 Tax=Thelephora terrestris TaxID=56493 RepID=A0A9P6L3V2_9AGAM|nr:hypothetical protein BJ322DRAFT_1022916 [Thelephora terrestris]